MNKPSTRPDHLVVIADHTPGAHVTDSEDIQWWWPILGPTSSACAVLLARHARHADVNWPAEVLARRLGLGTMCSTLWASLDRLAMFGLLEFVSTDVATIRVNLPALSTRQLNRLEPDFAAAYLATISAEAAVA